MQLVTFRKANRDFFAKSCRLPKSKWLELIKNEAIQGKILDGEPLIDADYFASNTVLESRTVDDIPDLLG